MASTTAPRLSASSRRKRARDPQGRLLELVAGLTAPVRRTEAARALAAHAGAEHLLIFLRDAELGLMLPAPGFPQTLPQMDKWQTFLAGCLNESSHETELPFPDSVSVTPAIGVGVEGGAVLVLLGGEPDLEMTIDIGLLLPLIAAALRGERTALVAEAHATLAKQSARQAKLLTASLDRARDQLRQTLAEANRANAAKDRFLAVLSHELRTPLNPVLMTASALEVDPTLPPEVRADIALIRRNVELEANLIEDLLDLTRIANGRVVLRRREVDAHELLRDAIDAALADPASTCLNLQAVLEAPVHFIEADAARIQQVFWNLIRNAAKFTSAQGQVVIQTDNPEPGRLRIRVIDDGIGIAAEALPKIFTAFEQGDASIAPMFGGLGLGLAISKTITELHQGQLSASSAGPGKGATFAFELPARAQTAAANKDAAAPPKTGGRRRILIVEDHRSTAEVMERLLARAGHQITLAHTQAEAIAVAQAQPFDIIISDLGLPDGDGYEVLKTIRRTANPVGIAVSGYGTENDIARSTAAGFRHHLTKPIHAPQLCDLINQIGAEQTDSVR